QVQRVLILGHPQAARPVLHEGHLSPPTSIHPKRTTGSGCEKVMDDSRELCGNGDYDFYKKALPDEDSFTKPILVATCSDQRDQWKGEARSVHSMGVEKAPSQDPRECSAFRPDKAAGAGHERSSANRSRPLHEPCSGAGPVLVPLHNADP
ncbi:uncharacterized protein B0I36DRAFT_399992, partial [Microdochium trichocladiopsis]